KYNSLLSILRNELHSNYSKYFIIKDIKLKDIPFQLKPLLFELHNEYKRLGNKINFKYICNYTDRLNINKLIFTLNYYNF
ncbi:MAG: hypothetical protein CMG46_00315, partial [Candidatus Marinimicrobia bacterium]|nr:hypothetical protein [Candidatus Neomarinimicrobiota bacterium]